MNASESGQAARLTPLELASLRAALALGLAIQRGADQAQLLALLGVLTRALEAERTEARAQLVAYRRHHAGLPALPNLPPVGQ